MERVIKIQSENSLVQTFDNNTTAPTQKLVDYKIPEGSVYDLSKSYISLEVDLDCRVADQGNVDGVKPVAKYLMGVMTDTSDGTRLNHMGESHQGDNTLFVKNVSLVSNRRGVLESIRRVDTLKLVQHNLEKDDIEIQRNIDADGVTNPSRGPDLYTGYYLDEVRITQSTPAGGTTETADDFTGLTGDNVSRKKSREHKIYLKDLLGIAKGGLYDTSKYGETRIHCELNLDKLQAQYAQGTEGVIPLPAGTASTFRDNFDDQTCAANTPSPTIIGAHAMVDPEYEHPFFVGQLCNITSTNSAGANVNIDAIIVAQVANVNGTVSITFNKNVLTAEAGAPSNHTDITCTPKRVGNANIQISILNSELNLVEVLGNPKTPDQLSYITYSTEELNGNGLATLNTRTHLEPNAQTLYIANCETGQIAPENNIDKYRIAIDNVDITGNRDVKYGSTFHIDRLERAYLNKGVQLKNEILRLTKHTSVAAFGNQKIDPLACVVEPLELKNEEKLLQLELKATGTNQDVILYKELVVTK